MDNFIGTLHESDFIDFSTVYFTDDRSVQCSQYTKHFRSTVKKLRIGTGNHLFQNFILQFQNRDVPMNFFSFSLPVYGTFKSHHRSWH